ncbi:MAG: DMT family transporter [Alicyclobacillus sp.]|nr:DMT family transporter [Alicyclobacillus sp.]
MHRTSLYALLVLLAGSSYGVVSVLVKEAVDHGCDVRAVTVGQYVVAAGLLWLGAGLAAVMRRLRGQAARARRVETERGQRDRPVQAAGQGQRGWQEVPDQDEQGDVQGRVAGFGRQRLQWGLLAAIGLSSMATSYAYYKALAVLPASLAIVLLFQFSWLVLLMDIVVTQRWPGVEKWLGVGLIVAGTLLAVGLSSLTLHGVAWKAVALGLVSAFTYGLSLYLSGFVRTDTPPLLRSAVTVSLAALAIVCLLPARELFSGGAWPSVWLWSLAIAVFGQALPLVLLLVGIPHTGGRMAGVLGSIELPVAVFCAWLVLGEPVTLWRWCGVLLILVGIAVSEYARPSERSASTKH